MIHYIRLSNIFTLLAISMIPLSLFFLFYKPMTEGLPLNHQILLVATPVLFLFPIFYVFRKKCIRYELKKEKELEIELEKSKPKWYEDPKIQEVFSR